MQLAHSYSAIKLYDNCPLRYFRQRIVKDVQDEGGTASLYGQRVHKFMEDRMNGTAPLPEEVARYEQICQAFIKLAEGGELHVEKELVLTENLTPTGWWEPDAWLRSKLDVMVLRGELAVVADWKTGKRNPDFFQMMLFAAQVFKHYPQVQRVKTSLVWLKFMQMDTEIYSREKVNSIWADIMARIRPIYVSVEHDNWPAKPSGLCRYCPARHDCDFARL